LCMTHIVETAVVTAGLPVGEMPTINVVSRGPAVVCWFTKVRLPPDEPFFYLRVSCGLAVESRIPQVGMQLIQRYPSPSSVRDAVKGQARWCGKDSTKKWTENQCTPALPAQGASD
jgi:hypothetical protein